MPDIKYVTVLEDYFENDLETGKPRLIHAKGARIQERAARAYGDAIKVKEDAGAPVLPFEVEAPAKPKRG